MSDWSRNPCSTANGSSRRQWHIQDEVFDANETAFAVVEPISTVSQQKEQSPQIPGQQNDRDARHGVRLSHVSGGFLSKTESTVAICFMMGRKNVLDVNYVNL